MKKILSLFLSVLMLLSITAGFEISAKAESNTIDTAYELAADGGSCFGKVDGDNKSDFYKINVYASGTLKLNVSATKDIVYKLYKSDGKSEVSGKTLSYSSNFGRVQETLELELRGGLYYLEMISRWGDTDSSYQVSTSYLTHNESFPESDANNNDYVDTASPITFDTLYYGSIGLSESDFYSFTVANKTDININLDYYTTMNNIKISLLDKYGKEINSASASATNGHIATDFIFESLEPGQYYLKIASGYSYGYLDGYGPYAFSVSAYCNHDFIRTLKDATYFKKGYYKDTCKKCGYSYIVDYIQKKKLSIPGMYLSIENKKLAVHWYTVSNASGYEIKCSTSKKFSKSKTKTFTVKGNSKNTKKIKIKSKKRYYVRVRAYKTGKVNGKKVKVYSPWSSTYSIKR